MIFYVLLTFTPSRSGAGSDIIVLSFVDVLTQKELALMNEQYTNDLKFIEKIDKLVSKKVVFFAYFFPLAACLLAHTLYMVLFALAGVRGMVIFNVGSILFYILTIVLAGKVKDPLVLVYASIAEIILHAVAATVFVGIMSNFCMFLLMVIPLAFLMPNKKSAAPFFVMFASVPLYGALNFFYRDADAAFYDISNTPFQMVFYIINIIIGSFVLIYVAVIFTQCNIYQAAKLRVQTEQLKIMASTDPLTKLSNRRAINRRLTEIVQECKESNRKYVVGIGDIDDFKRVNDTYGHDNGDIVLAYVGGVIAGGLPQKACASRWGGEEFLFVIPDSDIEEGRKCADEIIELIRGHAFEMEDRQFSITMTIGICEGTADDSVDSIITRADARLYKGKHNGKNHTEYTD